MAKIYKEILINAPKELVWEFFTRKTLYESWASCFQEGATFQGRFVLNEEISYLSSLDNFQYGVVGKLTKVDYPHTIEMTYPYEIKDGIKQACDYFEWERYSLYDHKDGCLLVMQQSLDESWVKDIEPLWDLSIKTIKEKVEASKNNYFINKLEIGVSIEKAYQAQIDPQAIVLYNFASDDWYCPWATHDARDGGSYRSRMEAKDHSFGFDFGASYELVEENVVLASTLEDGRLVTNHFVPTKTGCLVYQFVEGERLNPIEMQQHGWMQIFKNYQKYLESK